jgi:maltose/moltooligosaccharide transporter
MDMTMFYYIVAAIALAAMTGLARSRRLVVGFASVFFIHDQYLLFISFLLIGVAWAAMLAVPFTLLTNSLSGEHIGTYLGLFNGTICLPQIVAAACGGLVLKLVGGAQVSMFIAAAVLLVLGAVAVKFIKEGKNR